MNRERLAEAILAIIVLIAVAFAANDCYHDRVSSPLDVGEETST